MVALLGAQEGALGHCELVGLLDGLEGLQPSNSNMEGVSVAVKKSPLLKSQPPTESYCFHTVSASGEDLHLTARDP